MFYIVDIKYAFGVRGNYMNSSIEEIAELQEGWQGWRNQWAQESIINRRARQYLCGHKWCADLPSIPVGCPLSSELSPFPQTSQAVPQDARPLPAAVPSLGETHVCVQAPTWPCKEVPHPSRTLVCRVHMTFVWSSTICQAQIIFIVPLNSSSGFGVGMGFGDLKENKWIQISLPCLANMTVLVGHCLLAKLVCRRNGGVCWVPVMLLGSNLSCSLCSQPAWSQWVGRKSMMKNRCVSWWRLAPSPQGGAGSSDACLC